MINTEILANLLPFNYSLNMPLFTKTRRGAMRLIANGSILYTLPAPTRFLDHVFEIKRAKKVTT